MEFQVEFSPAADLTIEEQKDYYNNLVPALGDKFVRCVMEHACTLEKFPNMQLRYETVRCVPLKDFPFMIHYSVLEDRKLVRIHEVIHTSRNPENSWGNDNGAVSESRPVYLTSHSSIEFVPIASL